MSFAYSEQNRNEYYTDGLTVLRGLIPASLLADLRAQAEIARELARKIGGPSAQRLQPVYKYEELNPQPFRDFLNLDGLRTTVLNILGPEHTASDILGILFEPKENAWCTHWHRDWGYNVPGIDLDAFFEAAVNQPGMFNQLNGALYDDHCLWVVPGSHNRLDSDAEQARFPRLPPPGPELSDTLTDTEREISCLNYARSMPGGVCVPLFAGDVAFYRACAWHIGSYIPYTRRATLHDGFYSPADRVWQANVPMKK